MGRGGRKRKHKTDGSGSEEPAGSVKKSKSMSVLKPCSESKENLEKKQKKLIEKSKESDEYENFDQQKEIKEIWKSIRELTEGFRKLKEILLTKADLPEVSFREILLTKSDLPEEKETLEKKAECCFDCEEALENNWNTIFVKGFEYLRPKDEIKKLMCNIFGSCGEIKRVYVPFECETRCPLGFAFIDFKNPEDNDKALELNGCFVQRRQLEVSMAEDRVEYYYYTNFMGCKRCISGGEVPRFKQEKRPY